MSRGRGGERGEGRGGEGGEGAEARGGEGAEARGGKGAEGVVLHPAPTFALLLLCNNIKCPKSGG